MNQSIECTLLHGGTAMDDLWLRLQDLFAIDDGSLPDIFVKNLSGNQVHSIYGWIRSQSDVYRDSGEPTFWDRVNQCDVTIQSVDDPAQLVIDGHAEPFRHGLSRLASAGVTLPPLTIYVAADEVAFDYRMGSEWGPPQLNGLLTFLWTIQEMAPNATIFHAEEGANEPTKSFAEAWSEVKQERSNMFR